MIQKIHDLARNQEFLHLHRELNKFNIFHATGMINQEIKHTQFLGYLLDPNESHGFRDEFLTRFIQSIPKPENIEGFNINILDFNLSYTRIIKEKGFTPANGRLDLLMEIPSLANPEKTYVIAIENKIRAGEGEAQLQRYENSIALEYRGKIIGNPILLYLNINNEEPSDSRWLSILYSETVIKAVRGLIDDLEETLSDYIIFILNDYIEFINKEGGYESDNNPDKIIQKMDPGTIICAREISLANPKSIEHHRLEIRYKKALDYIANYDTDPRKALLAHFKSQFDENKILRGINDYRLRLESSSINWMRFSFLSNSNRTFLSEEICTNPTRNWLASQCNLAFELIFSKPNKDNLINCRVNLTLGPTGKEYQNRTKLLQTIRSSFNRAHKNLQADTNAEANDHWDAIKKHAFQAYAGNSLPLGKAKSWIEKTLKTIAQDNVEFINIVNADLKNKDIRIQLRRM